MFWNKIPRGYVETVDGYLIKESDAYKVEVFNGSLAPCHLIKTEWYRKENAPNFDIIKRGIGFGGDKYYKTVQVWANGTPVGYYTKEEVAKLESRIKELEGRYETTFGAGSNLDFEVEELHKKLKEYSDPSLKKAKRKNGKYKSKTNPRGAGRPKGSKNKKTA